MGCRTSSLPPTVTTHTSSHSCKTWAKTFETVDVSIDGKGQKHTSTKTTTSLVPEKSCRTSSLPPTVTTRTSSYSCKSTTVTIATITKSIDDSGSTHMKTATSTTVVPESQCRSSSIQSRTTTTTSESRKPSPSPTKTSHSTKSTESSKSCPPGFSPVATTTAFPGKPPFTTTTCALSAL